MKNHWLLCACICGMAIGIPTAQSAAQPIAKPRAAPAAKEKSKTLPVPVAARPVGAEISRLPLARILPPDPRAKKITALTFKSNSLFAKRTPIDGKFDVRVIIEGTLARQGWSLYSGKVRFPLAKDGAFRIELPMQAKSARLDLMAVGPSREIETQKITVIFEDWEKFGKKISNKPLKSFYLSGSIGLSLISYKESRFADYSTRSLTGKITYVQPLFPPTWDFGVTAYLTLLPLTKSAETTIRFFGANVRAGYVIPRIRDPWRVSIMGGLYYTTMIVSNNRFGFRNMAGPQLFPVVRHTLGSGDMINGYLKFSPVSANLSLLSFQNHERAIGATYVRPLSNGRSISGSLDLATLQLEISGIKINSSSFSLSIGFGL